MVTRARVLACVIWSRAPRRAVLLSAVLASVAAGAGPDAAGADRGSLLSDATGRGAFASAPAREGAPRALNVRRSASLPASASPAVVPEPCPPEAERALCGHVDVPFDRADASAGTIPIVFELYTHTDPGPAESVIMVNFGGPGASTTAMRWVIPYWFGGALDRHDLLLIDDRGRGRSGAIDCPAYQHGLGPTLVAEVGACADQLGATAVRYPTAEIARDYEAVRAALGYDTVDFVATSYGGIDAAAYATRFGDRLRSLVLDTPAGEPDLDPLDLDRAAAAGRTLIERVGLICERSQACARSSEEAVDDVHALVRRVRRTPVEGTGLDADGQSHELTVDPAYLSVHILDNTGGPFLTPGEIPAAADALRRGDAVPLLRLGAEGDFSFIGDSGDPAEFSQGAFSATSCLDQAWPWSADASVPERQAQWAQAVRAAPDAAFAPFRAEEILLSPVGATGGSEFCLPWPQTGTRPPVEPGARYPRVPTLVVDGEFDIGPVDVTAALYPNAKLVTITGAGHNAFSWSQCGSELATRFIETRKLGSTRCASQTPFDYPGVPAFPLLASDSRAATPGRGNNATSASLRIARVTADTALDALKRSFLSFGGDGPGLRGGSFHTDYGIDFTTTLTGARWTDDVAVNGTLHWSWDGGPLDAELQVDGPGGHDGTLHLQGGWLIPGAPRTITISGTLGGEHISATVPST